MPRRLPAFALLLLGAFAGCPKPPPPAPREVVMETPDPVAPSERTSAAALREPEPSTKKGGKRSTPKTDSSDFGELGDSSSAPAKPGTPAKPKTPGNLAKVSAQAPLPTDATLGALGLKILFLDVGQADSILVIGPTASLLIDAGEVTQAQSKSQNYRKIADAIREHTGRLHVDYFVPSHYHVDHIGSAARSHGLWGLIDAGLTIGTIVDRGDLFFGAERPGGWKEYPASVESWISSGIVGRRLTASPGTSQIDLGAGVTVEVISVNGNGILDAKEAKTPGYFEKCPPSENDYSVTLKISVGDFEFYTAGDLSGEDVERSFGGKCQSYNDVETSLAPRIGDVELYKVTHHGSEHSNNELTIKTLDPEVSVIPSGGGYNHPSKAVAARLTATGDTLDTGGFSVKEWPQGGPPEIPVAGDVLVRVAARGERYSVQYSGGTLQHRSYSDTDEAKELDQKETATLSGSK